MLAFPHWQTLVPGPVMYVGLYGGNFSSLGRPDVQIPLTLLETDLTCIVSRP